MTKSEFLDTLRRRLAGMSPREIDDVIGDYTTHFTDGMAAGRSEEDIAAALVGFFGGLFPAIRAARLPITVALQVR